uniref:Uncharacterized protein n=1 Tax=Ascaris lumbricoides TaxID=6252 RepID=A0A9J2PIV4_ASCLU
MHKSGEGWRNATRMQLPHHVDMAAQTTTSHPILHHKSPYIHTTKVAWVVGRHTASLQNSCRIQRKFPKTDLNFRTKPVRVFCSRCRTWLKQERTQRWVYSRTLRAAC